MSPMNISGVSFFASGKNIDNDDNAEFMRRFRMISRRDAFHFALHALEGESLSVEESRRPHEFGRAGDLDHI